METLDRRLLLAGLGMAGGSMLARLAEAGTLEPPPGPIGPTMKRLDEVEPRIAVQSLPGSASATHIISQPGSYYLTADVVGQSGIGGIEIASNDVSLDLCGFNLIGGLYSGSGIYSTAAFSRLAVMNGRVCGWRAHGLDLGLCEQCCVTNLHVAEVAHVGINVGARSVVLLCTARDCTDMGLNVASRSRVAECLVAECATGIRAGAGAVVERCRADSATSFGLDFVDGGQQVCSCVASQCATGIGCDGTGRLQGCSAAGCTVTGFRVRGAGNLICDCQASGGPIGFHISGPGNLLIRNTGAGNTQNYTIATGNAYGPLVNVAAAGDITSRTNSNHPWANFSF